MQFYEKNVINKSTSFTVLDCIYRVHNYLQSLLLQEPVHVTAPLCEFPSTTGMSVAVSLRITVDIQVHVT